MRLRVNQVAGNGLLVHLIKRLDVDLTLREEIALGWLIENYGYVSGIKNSFDEKTELITIGPNGNISRAPMEISKPGIGKQFRKFLSRGLIEPINPAMDISVKKRFWAKRYGVELYKVTVFGLYQYAKVKSTVPRAGRVAEQYWRGGNAFYKTVLNPFFEWHTFQHCPIEVDLMFKDFIRRSCQIIEEVLEMGRTIAHHPHYKSLDTNLDNPNTIAYLEEQLETALMYNAKEFAAMYTRDYALGRCGEYLYIGHPRPDPDMIMNYLAHDKKFMRILDLVKKEFDLGYEAAKRFEKSDLRIRYTMMP